MKVDLPHAVGPNQKRTLRIRAAFVTVPTALYDEPNALFSSEVDSCSDIRCRFRLDHHLTGLHRPRAYPAKRLRKGWMVRQKVWIGDVVEESLTFSALRIDVEEADRPRHGFKTLSKLL
jgi:hypothetical protein